MMFQQRARRSEKLGPEVFGAAQVALDYLHPRM